MVRYGCNQPGHKTLKLTVSQELVDGMNWFCACKCKFKKAKSNFNDFWVNVVKIGHGHLVHETLKSAEWVFEENELNEKNFFWPKNWESGPKIVFFEFKEKFDH